MMYKVIIEMESGMYATFLFRNRSEAIQFLALAKKSKNVTDVFIVGGDYNED